MLPRPTTERTAVKRPSATELDTGPAVIILPGRDDMFVPVVDIIKTELARAGYGPISVSESVTEVASANISGALVVDMLYFSSPYRYYPVDVSNKIQTIRDAGARRVVFVALFGGTYTEIDEAWVSQRFGIRIADVVKASMFYGIGLLPKNTGEQIFVERVRTVLESQAQSVRALLCGAPMCQRPATHYSPSRNDVFCSRECAATVRPLGHA